MAWLPGHLDKEFDAAASAAVKRFNHDGYTIERYLSEDPNDKLNDVAAWNFAKLPEAFGADGTIQSA